MSRLADSLIRRLLAHDLIRHNAVFFVGTAVISVFNYSFFPIVSRLVSVADFGEIQAVLAVFMQFGIILTTFGYVVVNITSNHHSSDERNRAILSLERIVMLLSITVFIVLCILSLLLKESLQFSSVIPIMLVGLLIILNVPSTSRAFYLQGLKQLKEVSISGIIFAAGKIILATLLILMFDVDVVMVVVAYILAQLAALVYLNRKTFELRMKSLTSLPLRLLRNDLLYGLAIMVLLAGITTLYLTDAIAVRLFFNPVESGLYSGVSAVSRIVFFVTASVAGVLIASVKMKDQYQKNLSLLYRSLGIITVIGSIPALCFMIFPKFSTTLLIGTTYAEISQLLPLLALMMIVCSYNNLLICFEIALRRFKAIYIVLVGVLIGGIAIHLHHDSLADIVMAYLTANLLVFVLLSMQIVMRKMYV